MALTTNLARSTVSRESAAAGTTVGLDAAGGGARNRVSGETRSRTATPRRAASARAVSAEEHAAITQAMIETAIREGRHSARMTVYCDKCGQPTHSIFHITIDKKRWCRKCCAELKMEGA